MLSIMSAAISRPASSASVSSMASNTPVVTHRRYRLKTLFHLPYSSGKCRRICSSLGDDLIACRALVEAHRDKRVLELVGGGVKANTRDMGVGAIELFHRAAFCEGHAQHTPQQLLHRRS